MSKPKFSLAEREAIYTVHGEKCYIGHEAITLREMQVDHVIPENLQNNPARLSQVLSELALPNDFELNSYENWLPACGPCNNEKRARVFRTTPLIQQELDDARKRAPEAKALADSIVSDRVVAKALSDIERAIEAGVGAERLHDEIERLAALATSYREPVLRSKPFRIDDDLVVVQEGKRVRVISGPYSVGGGLKAKRDRGAEILRTRISQQALDDQSTARRVRIAGQMPWLKEVREGSTSRGRMLSRLAEKLKSSEDAGKTMDEAARQLDVASAMLRTHVAIGLPDFVEMLDPLRLLLIGAAQNRIIDGTIVRSLLDCVATVKNPDWGCEADIQAMIEDQYLENPAHGMSERLNLLLDVLERAPWGERNSGRSWTQ